MEVQTDRTANELLASCSPGNAIKHTTSTALGLLSPPLMADDKDSIYEFTDNNCSNSSDSNANSKCSPSNDSRHRKQLTMNDHDDDDDGSAIAQRTISIPTTLTDTPSSSPQQQQIQSAIGAMPITSSPSTSNEAHSPHGRNGNVTADDAHVNKQFTPESPRKILSGKPRAFAEANKAAAVSKAGMGRVARGRAKSKARVPMYQSQLTDNTVGIKIRLKKSLEAPILNATRRRKPKSAAATTANASASGSASKSSNRKRSRKSKQKNSSDSEDSDFEKRRRANHVSTEKAKQKKTTTTISQKDTSEPEEQSVWGERIPEEILLRIFENAVNLHGCLPTIVNIGQVCRLWHRVSLESKLWHTLDLATWTKDRSELNLKYIIENHVHGCKDLNLGKFRFKIFRLMPYWVLCFSFAANWKVTNIECVMSYLLEASPDLEGISLAGWKKFTGDQLATLVEDFKKLERIDLSSVNVSRWGRAGQTSNVNWYEFYFISTVGIESKSFGRRYHFAV